MDSIRFGLAVNGFLFAVALLASGEMLLGTIALLIGTVLLVLPAICRALEAALFLLIDASTWR